MYTTNQHGQSIGLEVPNWRPPPYPTRETLRGQYCVVEPINPARYGRELHEANCAEPSGTNWTYLAYGPFEEFSQYQIWLESFSTVDDPMMLAIIDAGADRAVGVAAYLRIRPEVGVIEVGHVNFSPRLQRTPAATEAIFLMLRYVFQLGYRRCEWKCDALNERSRKAALRLGFRFEGVFRQATVYKGRNRDTVWYSIIDPEWPRLESVITQWLAPANFDDDGRQRQRLSEMTGAPTV